MIAALVATTFALGAAPAEDSPPVDVDEVMVKVAQKACTRNPKLVRELFEIEHKYGLPSGLIAAAALRESSCRPEIHCGDAGKSCGLLQISTEHRRRVARVYRELNDGHPPEAKDPRRDWRTAAHYWARRVVRNYKRSRRVCKGRRGYKSHRDMLWASGNVNAVWRPKCAKRGRCKKCDKGKVKKGVCLAEGAKCVKWYCVKMHVRCAKRGNIETKHYRALRRWRKQAAKLRAKTEAGQ